MHHTVRKNSCKTTFILIECYLCALIGKTIHFSKMLLNSTVETGITTLSNAGIHFDPKLGTQSKFVFVPKQPCAYCGILRTGRKIWERVLGSTFVSLVIKSSLSFTVFFLKLWQIGILMLLFNNFTWFH